MRSLIAIGVFWNEIDWLDSALSYMDYWKPGTIRILEGCYDPSVKEKRSTDGTRERLEEYVRDRKNAEIIDNPTSGTFRSNQSMGLNKAFSSAKGKWVMVFTADQYFSKAGVDYIKERMKNNEFDYMSFSVYVFKRDLGMCKFVRERMSCVSPVRVRPKMRFHGRTAFVINKLAYWRRYKKNIDVPYENYHYFGARKEERIELKNSLGDRAEENLAVRCRTPFYGEHPEFAIPTLKKLGLLKGRQYV